MRDDFSQALGYQLEARFNAALGHLNTGNCPVPSGVSVAGVSKPLGANAQEGVDGVLVKAPWLENRIFDAP